jgi:hypothetical protein
VNRTLAIKETTNSTKHPKKNKNYNEILEKPFIFNLQTVSTARCRCRSSLSRPDIVGCRREIAERVMKTTSVPETKKKEKLPMKLLDDPKIPTARRNPRRPYHSHKPFDVAVEMGSLVEQGPMVPVRAGHWSQLPNRDQLLRTNAGPGSSTYRDR